MPLVPIWRGSTTLNEASVSPEWDFDDKVTCRRTFRGPYALCLASAPLKGTVGTGGQAGMLVSNSNVRRERGGIGVLVISYEGPAIFGILPPDEAGTDLEKIEKPLADHSRYDTLTDSIREYIKEALETADRGTYDTAISNINAYPPTLGVNLALELYTKLRKGNTHYPLYVPEFKVVSKSWFAPAGLTVGGFRQTPPSSPLVPPATDWLREGDRVGWNGTYWTTERRWLGGPDLDTDIFP